MIGKRRMRRPLTMAMLSLILLIVAGCSPSVPSSSSGLSGSSGSSGSASSSVLTQVLQSGVLKVGTITAGAPYESLNSSGQLVGYDIDLANQMAQDLGVKVQFTTTDLAGRVSLLQTGKVDVVLANFSETPQRAETVAFTQAYSLDTEQFMVSAHSSFQSISDLKAAKAVRVAMTRGVGYESLVKEILPGAQITFYTSDTDTIQALDSGQADAVAMDNFTLGQAAKSESGHFRILSGYLQTFPANIGVSLGDFEWWEWCNNFVQDIDTSGFNYSEYEKWIGGPAPSFMMPPAGTIAPVGSI